jgi:hypothetical protein
MSDPVGARVARGPEPKALGHLRRPQWTNPIGVAGRLVAAATSTEGQAPAQSVGLGGSANGSGRVARPSLSSAARWSVRLSHSWVARRRDQLGEALGYSAWP